MTFPQWGLRSENTSFAKALQLFGNQLCQDKVVSFLTPGYTPMTVGVTYDQRRNPVGVAFHEFKPISINHEFVKNFEDLEISLEPPEESYRKWDDDRVCIVITANYPYISIEHSSAMFEFNKVQIKIHSYIGTVEYKKGQKRVSTFDYLSIPIRNHMLDAYLDHKFVEEFINSNGSHESLDLIKNADISIKAAKIDSDITKFFDVHHTMDS